MNSPGTIVFCVLAGVLSFGSYPTLKGAPGSPEKAEILARSATAERDGQHDFDFEFGSWKVHLRRLQHPLTGSNSWTDSEGTAVVRQVWNGRANLVELEMGDGASRLEGLSLRLYNPQSRQWSINWADSREGAFAKPMFGEFKDGRGEFYDQEEFQGRQIYVQFIFSEITPNSFRGVQSYSTDGGKTWEPNWIETFTRIAPAAQTPFSKGHEGSHDFDFEIGTWKTELLRRLKPLTGSNQWVKLEGTSVVSEIWNGRANLVELEVDDPTGNHLEGLSLRLYNPKARQWSLNFASSRGGALGVPTIGEFKDGRGEFYDQEEFNGRTILVRNIWSETTESPCHFVQAFSDDGGKTWEDNWDAKDTRLNGEVRKAP